MSETSGFIYLASAYTKHPGGLEAAHKEACHAAGAVIRAGRAVFCPIAHSHPISLRGGVAADEHETWMEADRPLLAAANEVWVLCDDWEAWRESVGVDEEVRTAERQGKRVRYLVPLVATSSHCGYELLNAAPTAA